MTQPTKVLSNIAGRVGGGHRWVITSGKLYVGHRLVGVNMRRSITGTAFFIGEKVGVGVSFSGASVEALVAELFGTERIESWQQQ